MRWLNRMLLGTPVAALLATCLWTGGCGGTTKTTTDMSTCGGGSLSDEQTSFQRGSQISFAGTFQTTGTYTLDFAGVVVGGGDVPMTVSSSNPDALVGTMPTSSIAPGSYNVSLEYTAPGDNVPCKVATWVATVQ